MKRLTAIVGFYLVCAALLLSSSDAQEKSLSAGRGTSGPVSPNAHQAKLQKMLDQARKAFEDGSNDDALHLSARVCRLQPNNVDALVILGGALTRKKRYEEAIDCLTRAIELDPKNAYAYVMRGRAHYHGADSNLDAALKDLKKAVALDPHVRDGQFYLGVAYSTQSMTGKALDCLNKAIKLDPDNANIYFFRSGVYSALKQHKKSIDDMSSYIRLKPRDSVGFLGRAAAYEQVGQYQKAIEDYTSALKIKADDLRAYSLRAALYVKLRKLPLAIADYSKVLEHNSMDEDVLMKRADAYFAMHQYEKALKDYSDVIDMFPEHSSAAYEGRSMIYKIMGKADLAAKDMKKAAEIRQRPAIKRI
ncbi:MAG TPA: tetratricopeptide repeat protein [Candidatus Obscuribacterales bacterium]